ncbi:hypothetical protein IFM89_000214 [Coptis chinensis]|uniref:Uncharacterized protein n=1 Tax=Coptis chinensis TaxID=261450 RepID=A0A835I746_9MAGN|nr:hypothetical protein IFM89_000214 [Coptis chinensis]
MPTHNFPPVEIEKESSSSGGNSCSDSDSSSGRLPFTLLSDEGDKIRKEWGVPQIYSSCYDTGDRLMLLTRKV